MQPIIYEQIWLKDEMVFNQKLNEYVYEIVILIHLIYHLNQNISNVLKVRYKKINRQVGIIVLRGGATHTYISGKEQ